MELGLKGKVVLCMASAAGLGKGIATEMAREGAKVMLCTAEPFKDQLLEAQAEIEKRPETVRRLSSAMSTKQKISKLL